MTVAKGITNGCVPMGAVFAKQAIHDTFMNGPEHLIEFFHGYTYSAHPLACAAALGTLDTYAEKGYSRVGASMAPHFEDALHSLAGLPHVIDVRNIGLNRQGGASNWRRSWDTQASARSTSSSSAGSAAC